jgi:hypothetical protein
MQSKKLNNTIFAWDPAAFKGRGYWFVYNQKTGTLGRAASKEEAARLGKETGKEPKSPRVYEMSYQRADTLKNTGLFELIARKKFEEGQGLGASIKGAVSDKIRGRITRIKKTFDPLTLINALTGKGAIGRSIFTAIGRGMGRSDRDIGYFGGYTRTRGYDRSRKAEPMSVHIAAGKVTPIVRGDGPADGISKLYSLFKEDYEQKIKKSELQKDFEEQKNEKIQKRHEELIKALKSIGATPGAKPGQKSGGGLLDFLEKIKGMIDDAIGKLMDKLEGLLQFSKMLGGNAFKILRGLASFLISPVGLSLIGLTAFTVFMAWLSGALKDYVKENVNNMKALSPDEAAAVLASGSERDIKALGGKEKLEDIVKNGKAQAIELLKDPEKNKQAIIEAGGIEKVKAIAGDTKEYKVPERIDTGPVTVPPRPDTTGGKNKARAAKWDNQYGQDYNPDGTKKTPTATPAAPTPTPVATATPMPSTGAGGGRGGQGGATAEQASMATPAPSVSPTGGQMVAATNENMEAQQDTSVAGPATMVINKTNTSAMGGKSESGSIGETAVRNDEDSFLRTIKQSLRMV